MSIIKFICAEWIATSWSGLKNSLLIGGCGTHSHEQVHREIVQRTNPLVVIVAKYTNSLR